MRAAVCRVRRPQLDIPELVELYRAGRLRLEELISESFELDRIDDAIGSAKAGAQLRPVLLFPAGSPQPRTA